ncbi:hypothetical protein AB0I60_00705 [Actinosynnema sp. NPDC050436]|uniref:hypothetical protein n=1 Tax=Actinosynnema sp. NPDC050436 TaxID=3155659 RepID=UPI0033EBF862
MQAGRTLAATLALLALGAVPGTAHAAPSVTVVEAYGNGSAWVKYTYSCDPGSATTAGVLVTSTSSGIANSYPVITCDGVTRTAISGTTCVTSCNFRPGTGVRVTVGVAGVREVKSLGLLPRP